MKTLVFAARKGGSSKTTLLAHISVEASKTQPVTLIDSDAQPSLTGWWEAREAGTPTLMDVPLVKLAKELAKAADKPGLVMIDTPPHNEATIASVMALADLIIIPVKPSPNDLRAIGATIDMARASGKPFVFVICQAIARTTIVEEARALLAAHGPVVATVMHNRLAYAVGMADGRTAQELGAKSRAASEISAIWKAISKQLTKTSKGKHG